MDKYWYQLNSFGRKGTIVVNVVLLGFQIFNSFDPKQSYRKNVNIVFYLVSIINFVIIALSYKKSYGVKFSYYATIIMLIRLAFRWLDVENSKKVFDPFEYKSMLITQATAVYFIIGNLSFLYANISQNKIILPLIYMFVSICLFVGINDTDQYKVIVSHFASHFCTFVAYTFLLGKYITSYYDIIFQKSKLQKFK